MARIPVEHERKGSPWWLWLVGLLIVAGLIWLLSGLFDPDEPAEEAEGVESVAPVEPITQPVIMDPLEIRTATTPAEFVGREVEFEMMRVVSVPGDSIFVMEKAEMAADTMAEDVEVDEELVGSTDNRILVVLDENIPAPPDSVEGEVNVNPDQIVRVSGVVRELNDQMLQAWNLPEINVQEIAQNGLYVRAREVTVVERADGPY